MDFLEPNQVHARWLPMPGSGKKLRPRRIFSRELVDVWMLPPVELWLLTLFVG